MKEIKEFENFEGQDGYLIVDGLDAETPGGKIKVPNYSGVTDGYVLTKTTTDGTDDIVWSAPQGGGGNPFSIDEMLTWKNNTGTTTLAAWLADNPADNHVDGGNLQTSIKSDNAVVKYQYILHAGSGSFYAPWAS